MSLTRLMLVLALLLCTVCQVQADRYGPRPAAPTREHLSTRLHNGKVINKDIIVERLSGLSESGEIGAITFSSDLILFDFGSAKLNEASYRQLTEIAKALNDPAVSFIPYFFVDGHTCNIGTDAFNCRLSLNRAGSVVRFLTEKGGVSPKRLRARGFGEREPLDSNQGEKNRIKNRRVVLKSGLLGLEKDKDKMCSATK